MKICTYPQEVYCLVPPLVSNTFLLQLICNMAMTSFTSRIDTCTSTYRTEISLRRCSAALLARLQLACCSLNPNTTLLVVVTTQRFTCQTLSRIVVILSIHFFVVETSSQTAAMMSIGDLSFGPIITISLYSLMWGKNLISRNFSCDKKILLCCRVVQFHEQQKFREIAKLTMS